MAKRNADDITDFDRLLGVRCLACQGGRARYEFEVRKEHLNRRGVAHGGVVASLLDTALGEAVVSVLAKEEWCGTLQLSVQFREPVRPGRVVAEGRLVRKGRTAAFVEGELRSDAGKVLAAAHGTWTIWPHRPS